MTAYIIMTRTKTIDPSELEIYAAKARPTLAGRPVTFLAVYGKQMTLEGSPTEGVVILAFPTTNDALSWYESPDYVAARSHRMLGAQYDVTLVDGV